MKRCCDSDASRQVSYKCHIAENSLALTDLKDSLLTLRMAESLVNACMHDMSPCLNMHPDDSGREAEEFHIFRTLTFHEFMS